MLVLSRKVGERIVIADNITIVVHKVAGNRVSLGVEAPRDVRVVRGELRKLVEAIAISPTISAAPLGELSDDQWTRLPGTVRAR
ncbi:MAG: carbon storage regulator [Pirellulaceae bacterium]|jgi:carbon storage regulator|nr:carbon storage regulator [Pirellulaceae bacterium]